MMTGAILKSWKTIKNHVPLIKFRKGESFRGSAPSVGTISKSGGNPPGVSASSTRPVLEGTAIEDWQLPPNYRRAPLDDKEIDAINSGGAY